MSIPFGQSMPRQIMDEIRNALKDRESVIEFFDLARKAVKSDMEKTIKAIPATPKDDRISLFIRYMMQNETLKRIDDFEMVHLNIIDVREECRENNNQDIPRHKTNIPKLVEQFMTYTKKSIDIVMSSLPNSGLS